jgi:hypothetical protein
MLNVLCGYVQMQRCYGSTVASDYFCVKFAINIWLQPMKIYQSKKSITQ